MMVKKDSQKGFLQDSGSKWQDLSPKSQLR